MRGGGTVGVGPTAGRARWAAGRPGRAARWTVPVGVGGRSGRRRGGRGPGRGDGAAGSPWLLGVAAGPGLDAQLGDEGVGVGAVWRPDAAARALLVEVGQVVDDDRRRVLGARERDRAEGLVDAPEDGDDAVVDADVVLRLRPGVRGVAAGDDDERDDERRGDAQDGAAAGRAGPPRRG